MRHARPAVLIMAMFLGNLAGPAWSARIPVAAPVYYLIDYGAHHIDNPQYIEWAQQLPPELLHFGKDVAFTHIYGPIAAVGGENQAHGRNREDIRRLTPAEVHERLAALRRMNENLHHAGVKLVMPYIAAITFAGDPVTREGFFDFFDHWDEYAEFGIGPRLAGDPVDWAAVKADGSYHTFGPDLAPAYFTGMNRYVACLANPDWRRWLCFVTRYVAEAGYDGTFPDNSTPILCYGPHGQAQFRQFLAERYTPGEMQELFGHADPLHIELPTGRGDLLWVEFNRFWQITLDYSSALSHCHFGSS